MALQANEGGKTLTQEQAQEAQELLERALYELKKVIVGQEHLLERLLIAVIAHGHVLVEGAPGLAKTLTLKSLARVVSVDFKRVQFTPDLLPSDLTGTRIYSPNTGEFSTELGPVFTNFVLADEINRAPAKVQSALLEAMEENQVTIGKETFALKAPFLVMATQNPIENEGTYPLPEAQLDRFLFKLLVSYPDAREEMVIVQRVTSEGLPKLASVIGRSKIEEFATWAKQVYVDPKIISYIVDLVQATRRHSADVLTAPGLGASDAVTQNVHSVDLSVRQYIRYGASPRASLAITNSSKALALLRGRNYVTPDDVLLLFNDCLRHRIILSYEGLAAGKSTDDVLNVIKKQVAPPKLTGV